MRPRSLKEAVARTQVGIAPLVITLNEFYDEFYTRVAERQAMIDDAPPLLNIARDDAYIGAVGEHLARRWGLTIPTWTDDPCRFLHDPYFVDNVTALKAIYLRDSPYAFRRRFIFTEYEPLRRARFPAGELRRHPSELAEDEL